MLNKSTKNNSPQSIDAAIKKYNQRIKKNDSLAKSLLRSTKKSFQFIVTSKKPYLFAPLKPVTLKYENKSDYSELKDKINSTDLRKHIIKIGYQWSRNNFDNEFNKWLIETDIKLSKNKWNKQPHIYFYTFASDLDVLETFLLIGGKECFLRENLVLHGNKSLQGCLGEWIFEKAFAAEPLQSNQKGADFKIGKHRYEIKTKRPAPNNPSACELSCNKLKTFDKKNGSDYIVIFFFNDLYKIKNMLIVSEKIISNKYKDTTESFKKGKRCSYEVHPERHFYGTKFFAECINDLNKVEWKGKIVNIDILINFFSE